MSEKAIRGMLVSRRRAYRQMEEGTGKINEWVVGEDGTVSMSESFLAAGNVDSPLATGKRHSLDRRELTRGVPILFHHLRLWPCPVLDVDQPEMGMAFKVADAGQTYRVKLELSMKWMAPNEPGSRFRLWQEGHDSCCSEVAAAERAEAVLPGIRPETDGMVVIRGIRGEGLRSNVYFLGVTVEKE